VRRGGGDLTSSFRWRVSPPDTARPVVYSDRTLASIVDPAVIALLVLAVGLALAPLVRRALARGTHVPRIREESP
jgi:uncharacterized RDD family membrane protein YckC